MKVYVMDGCNNSIEYDKHYVLACTKKYIYIYKLYILFILDKMIYI